MTILKEIDKNEFFWDNPQMLGFTNTTRATVMVVKEIIDNALDACEDIRVLPEIYLKLTSKNNTFHLYARDNGSGIPDPSVNVPHVFGEILFGSRFGTYKQSRGQQGIGVSAAFLWSQKTVGEPVRVITKHINDKYAYEFLLTTKGKGKLVVLRKQKIIANFDHGTIIHMKFKGSWRCKQHLLTYLEATALANPEASFYIDLNNEHIEYQRTTSELPRIPKAIKPHPHAADIGLLEELIANTKSRKLKNFLTDNFSSFGDSAIKELSRKLSFSLDTNPKKLTKSQLRELVEVIKTIRFRAPSSDCLAPIGSDRIISTLMRYNPEFCDAVTRDMFICDGHPSIVEVGIAYGGNIKGFKLFRLANKVPLIYDESACALTEGIKVNYKNYRLKQRDDGLPDENMILFVHLCSTLVPYGTQAKTYVAHKDEIINDVKLAVQYLLRKLSLYRSKKEYKKRREKEINERMILSCALFSKLSEILDENDTPPYESIAKICRCALYDEKNKLLINTTNDVISIGSIKLKPGESIKLNINIMPPLDFIITTSIIDKCLTSLQT